MNKISGLINIARKAGYVIVGQDDLSGYAKKLYLILMDKNAGSSLSREMNYLSKKKGVPIFQIDDLGNLVSIENCKVLGVKNKAISENIIECLLKGE